MIKKIATIQDISCVGKCSLTVALPVISAMGIEAAVIPTGVFSTHTMFPEFFKRDLTEDIPQILSHWKKEDFQFEAVYSGYLASGRQIDLVKEAFRLFNPPLRYVDPAMADGGKMYVGFPDGFAEMMATLCAEADVIVPNLTEACFMTDTPYREDGDKTYLQDLMKKLAARGTGKVILTGAPDGEHGLGAMCYDAQADCFHEYYNEKLPVKFHGTGDIFASTLLGAMVLGHSIDDVLKIAVDFTLNCIRGTITQEVHDDYGVEFEKALPDLIKML